MLWLHPFSRNSRNRRERKTEVEMNTADMMPEDMKNTMNIADIMDIINNKKILPKFSEGFFYNLYLELYKYERTIIFV